VPDPAVECVLAASARVGECPLWSQTERRLYWVDIESRRIHRFDPASGDDERRTLPGRPGSIALTSRPGRLLVAMEHVLAFFDWEADTVETWIELEPAGTGNRLNDGCCDPAGRFWVGSMFDPTSAGRKTGMLHRVDPDGSSAVLRTGIGVSNGLAFTPDGTTMYFADTHRDTIWAHDYDLATGEPTRARVFLDFGAIPGRPDGACIDEDGCLWIACVHGGAIIRVTPDGEIDRRIELPVPDPTMTAFGGPDLATLFVTSLGGDGEPGPRTDGSLAGALFAIDVGVRGVGEPVFGRS
jgi:sugar lactone lactonase YvrE